MSPDAVAVCETCGMPVRVIFADDGTIEKVLAVCRHIQEPGPKKKDASNDG